MNGWLPISEETPRDRHLLLWLKADDGNDEPIGELVGRHVCTEFFEGWVEKSATGQINTGLRQVLVTHYKLLDGGPDG